MRSLDPFLDRCDQGLISVMPCFECANVHFEPVDGLTVPIHGSHDDIAPIDRIPELVCSTFCAVDHHAVADEHAFHRSATTVDSNHLLRVA